MAGATSPACHRQIVLKGVVSGGEGNSCEASLELTIAVRSDDGG